MRIRDFSSTSSLNCTPSYKPPPAPSSSPSPPSNSSTSIAPSFRCKGLDLLVMAVGEVEGRGAGNAWEEVGVKLEEMDNGGIEGEGVSELGTRKRSRRRQMTMPTKFQDSILQPWKKRKTGPRLSR